MDKKAFREISEGKKVKLSEIPTYLKNKEPENKLEKQLEQNREILSEQQTLLYANRRQSLLVIFQGMDTSGKDGAIKHVMTGINPQGCSVESFKTPTHEELDHDFLWRAHKKVPARGMIGIFNRSYYEDVLITKVHPDLLERAKLPKKEIAHKDFWLHRYKDINHFEKYLQRQGTEVVKIFIHISKQEQEKRLAARFADPKKHWKISEGDISERKHWAQYQKAYEDCLSHTSTESAPWFVIAGDDKDSARHSVSEILIQKLSSMKLEAVKLSQEQKMLVKKLAQKLK